MRVFLTTLLAILPSILRSRATEYCLIGDDDFLYTKDSHLEFLLKLMEVADIAGGAVMQGGIMGHYEGFYRWTPAGVTLEEIDRTYPTSHAGIRYSPADYVFNFFIAKTEALRRVRWDEQFHASWEHEDFFLSAQKAGLKTVYCPDSVVVHRGSWPTRRSTTKLATGTM
jgi:GT2 family glycosyltransferase